MSSTEMENNTNLASIFFEYGRDQPSGANHPFRLDQTGDVFLITGGQVDLFAVNEESGETGLHREFLCSFKQGTMLFSADLSSLGLSWNLTCFGDLESKIKSVNRDLLLQRSHACNCEELLFGAYEQYLSTLSEATGKFQKPQLFNLIDDETTEIKLGPKTVIGTLKALVWVEHRGGPLSFSGNKDLFLSESQRNLLPLPRGFWLESLDKEAHLISVDPNVAQLSDFVAALDRFMGVFGGWTELKMEYLQSQDVNRLKKRSRFENEFFDIGISDLTQIVEGDKKADRPTTDTDPVFSAFRAVGKKSQIVFLRPPRWQSPWLWDREADGGTETIKSGQYSNPVEVISQFSKIRYRKVILEDRWWETDNGPMIAFTELDQNEAVDKLNPFAQTIVALLPKKSGGYELYDPRNGAAKVVGEEEIRTLEPAAYTFYRPFLFEKLKIFELIKYVYKDILGDFRIVFLVALASFLLGLLTPIITAHLFNTIIPTSDGRQLLQMAGVLLIASFAGILFNAAQGWALLRIETKINSTLQAAVFDRILKLPIPFFRQYSNGDLAVRATGINRIRQAVGGATMRSIMGSLAGAGNLVMLFYYSNKMMVGPEGGQGVSGVYLMIVAGLAILLLNVTLTGAFGYYTLIYQRRVQAISGRIASLVNQLLISIPKLRVAGMEGRAFSLWSGQFSKSNRLNFKATHLGNYIQIYNIIIPTASSIIFYWLVSHIIGDKPGVSVATGSFLAFYAAFTTFMGSLTELASTLIGLVNVVPALERSRPLIDTPGEVDSEKTDPNQLSGHIQVNNLSFRYNEDGPLILNDVSFEIQPGEFVAFVGPSGSGKSSTMRLLLGFEIPEGGGIFYDGQELVSIDVTSLRRQIGVVSQQSGVIAGSILQNIIGASNLTHDDAFEAARMAGFEDDIREMPMGMHTVLSEGGSTLSGGQRQRLLIARALVNKPRILFFDEATSALDNRTQQIITNNLEKMDAVRLVIAHRLSTIQNADRIFVMESGHIVQSGSFDALMAEAGLFADLAARQVL